MLWATCVSLLVSLFAIADPTPKCGDIAAARRIEGAVKPPRIRKRVEPRLPEDVRKRRREQPFLFLELRVDAYGRVGAVKIVRSNAPDLERYVVAAIRQFRLDPATLYGRPIPVIYNLSWTYEVR